nr:immunoglobulin light chain junction region [Macaca mulatta]MPO03547.1 immunoglobulin light chain junction region [Macaca mulatta]MPO06359.1 immunoglobulin light chain junction region [Macaca mulatta]MPO11085.1 immunoglobulin light chain junction region [Macaca mulatta]MPO12951.1 immunoglobulin light chain junction region [Macaca mulatta]
CSSYTTSSTFIF